MKHARKFLDKPVLMGFTLLLSANSFAGALVSLHEFLADNPCTSQINTTLQKWNAQAEWREEHENLYQVLMIKAPTNAIGTWVFLEKDPSGQNLTGLRISPHTKLQVSWSSSDCKSTIKEFVADKAESSQSDGTTSMNAFDDSKLKTLLEQKRPGLIYVFSPGMHLSLGGIEEAKKAAKSLHLDLTILIDPQFKDLAAAELEKLTRLKTRDVQWMDTNELNFRGMTAHYPSLIVYNSKGSLSGVFPGRKSDREYVSFAQEALK